MNFFSSYIVFIVVSFSSFFFELVQQSHRSIVKLLWVAASLFLTKKNAYAIFA